MNENLRFTNFILKDQVSAISKEIDTYFSLKNKTGHCSIKTDMEKLLCEKILTTLQDNLLLLQNKMKYFYLFFKH